MTARFMNLLFTPEVQRQQEIHGSRSSYAKMAGQAAERADLLGEKEAMFLATRDSFYLASTSASGWPYVQHRGGPAGFVKLLTAGRIGFADYRGNRQYVSLGNVVTDDRVALFFMDYVRRARLKLLGRMTAIDLRETPDLASALTDDNYGATVERGFVVEVEAFDWNCPQHITPRYTINEVRQMTQPLNKHIEKLEKEIEQLRAERK